MFVPSERENRDSRVAVGRTLWHYRESLRSFSRKTCLTTESATNLKKVVWQGIPCLLPLSYTYIRQAFGIKYNMN